MDYWMVPLKTMNVTLRRIALNAKVIGDVRNAMVAVTWIVMFVMVMDSAGTVEVMVVHVAQNVVATEDADTAKDLERFCVEIAMVEERFIITVQIDGKNAANVVVLGMRHALNAPQLV